MLQIFNDQKITVKLQAKTLNGPCIVTLDGFTTSQMEIIGTVAKSHWNLTVTGDFPEDTRFIHLLGPENHYKLIGSTLNGVFTPETVMHTEKQLDGEFTRVPRRIDISRLYVVE